MYHGQRQLLRAEALPQGGHGDIRRPCRAKPQPTPLEVGRGIVGLTTRNTGGSLGCAISRSGGDRPPIRLTAAMCWAAVLNQVLLHQSIIGLRMPSIAMDRIRRIPRHRHRLRRRRLQPGGHPDCAVHGRTSCPGPRPTPRFIAVEPASCPSLTRGRYAYDYCDTGKITPAGAGCTPWAAGFIPSSNHAGGLRYHGMSPMICPSCTTTAIVDEARSVEPDPGVRGGPPASPRPKPSCPRRNPPTPSARPLTKRCSCREERREPSTILFGLTGTGYFDLAAFQQYNTGAMVDLSPTEAELIQNFRGLEACAPGPHSY